MENIEQDNQSKGAVVWKKILNTAISMPGVKVDRRTFLQNELIPFLAVLSAEEIQQILSGEQSIPSNIREKIVKGCMSYHLRIACSLSAVAGLPGGWAMAASIPADVAQFYAQILILIQKMLYLYGWPDLMEENKGIPDESLGLLTLWIGVAMGSVAAQNAITQILEGFAKQAVKRIPRIAFGHSAVYIAIKNVGKWIGIKVTKASTARGLSKVIPLIGAPISATMTYATFRPMSKRLKKYLDSTKELKTT